MPVVSSHPVGGSFAVAVLQTKLRFPEGVTLENIVFPDRNRRFIYPTEVDQEKLFLSLFFLNVSHRYSAVQLPL